MYNFYIYIIIISIIYPLKKYLMKNIYHTISVVEQLLFSNVTLFIIFGIIYYFSEKTNIIELIKSEENNFVRNILIYDGLIVFSLLIGGYILYKEKVIYCIPIKKSCYLIIIALISCIYKDIFNIKFFIGIALLIIGIFFIEFGNKS